MTQPIHAAELQSLQAQLNALSQFALRAVAVLEMNGLVHGPTLEAALRAVVWPEPINGEAQSVTAHLCDQLAQARNSRQAQGLQS